MSPGELVERCLDLMGPVPATDSTREALTEHVARRGELDLDFNPLWSGYFYDKGISLIAANGEGEDAYPSETDRRWSPERRGEHILGLMEDGRLQPSRLITHRMHYTDTVKAYQIMETRDKNMLGVVFDWSNVEG
jgi:threonine dehydrogenase-like Zn-dependent dehydrogenase